LRTAVLELSSNNLISYSGVASVIALSGFWTFLEFRVLPPNIDYHMLTGIDFARKIKAIGFQRRKHFSGFDSHILQNSKKCVYADKVIQCYNYGCLETRQTLV